MVLRAKERVADVLAPVDRLILAGHERGQVKSIARRNGVIARPGRRRVAYVVKEQLGMFERASHVDRANAVLIDADDDLKNKA